ncbi:MAG: TolC family outer membrane protein [Pseudomonadales bacterium]|nr:TolC family outer membrane protein [Pseudomonadales bacterium]MBO6597709.1 TolC family outer membrane protein [Pseudomonadales bacterium]MBO6823947.1 TolC family outer membrane protein [Pseudomonadales bacterium]
MFKVFFRAMALFVAITTFTTASAATLEEIYDLAVDNDPELGAAQAVFLSRNEVVDQSRALILPSVFLGGQTSNNKREFLGSGLPDSEFNDHSWSAVLTQPVFRLDSWYRFQQSKNIQAEALANFAAEQQALLVRVAESYFAILDAEAALSASNAERDAVQRQLEQVQQRFDVGLVAITDVLESQAAFDSSTVNVIEAEGLQSTSFEPLVRLTGSIFDDINGLADDFPVRYPDPQNEDAWVQMALENNYSLAAARERMKTAERGLKLAKSGHYPTIDAQVQYAHSVSGGTSFLGDKIDQTSAILSMNVPIYQGGGVRSQVKAAGYDLEAAQKNMDLIQRQVVENTRNLYIAINTDVARVRARLRGIESSQSALDATQTGYEVGTRNIVDVLNAQRNLFLSQFQYASARHLYVLDTLRLKQIVGTLSPQDLYDLNQFIDSGIVVSRTTPTTR